MHRLDIFNPLPRSATSPSLASPAAAPTAAASPSVPHGATNDQPINPNARYHVFRRITGYHNALENQLPPDYERQAARQPLARAYDPLPPYECTVAHEGILYMKMERPDPFHKYNRAMWEAVHVRLQGTLLQISTPKVHGLFTHSSKRGTFTGEPARLIRTFTLQHAEVGLASDYKKYELIPKSYMVQLLSEATIRHLQQTEPDQFYMVYNHVARLRLEETQLVFRFGNADDRARWLDLLCAAIDISPPLEARSEPRNHTLPRRRRRDRHAAAAASAAGNAANTTDAETEAAIAAVAAAERNEREQAVDNAEQASRVNDEQSDEQGESHINDESMPSMLDRTESYEPFTGLETTNCENEVEAGEDCEAEGEAVNNASAQNGPDLDGDDLDLDMMAAGQHSRHGNRSAGSPQGFYSPDDWSDAPWKNMPPPTPDASREARYRRRCMPMLVSNSRYANDIIMHKGRRVVIDWVSQTLQAYPLQPPAYGGETKQEVAETASGEAPTRIKRILRQATSPEIRTLGRLRSKESVSGPPAHSGATDQSRDDQRPSLALKKEGSWSKRIRALARVPSSKEGISSSEQQDRDIAAVGLSTMSPTHPAPQVHSTRTVRNKASQVLGHDAQSLTQGASRPPMSRNTTESSNVDQRPAPQDTATDTRPSYSAAHIGSPVPTWSSARNAVEQRKPSVASQSGGSDCQDSSTESTTSFLRPLQRGKESMNPVARAQDRAFWNAESITSLTVSASTPTLVQPIERPNTVAATLRPGQLQGDVPSVRRIKRIQSTDAIPTRPRHHEKAYRTLGIVS